MSNLEPRNWNVWSYSLTGLEKFTKNMECMWVFWNISQILQCFDVVSWTTLGDVNIHTNPKRCGIFRTIFGMCLSFGCYNDKILAVFCSLVFGWGHVCLLNGREVALLIEASRWAQGAVWPLYQLRRQLTNKSTFLEDAVRVSVYTEVFEKSPPPPTKSPKNSWTMLDHAGPLV